MEKSVRYPDRPERSRFIDSYTVWNPFSALTLLVGRQEGPAIRRYTRSSADADNRLDAFSGQSRSTNMVPFHM